MHNVLQVTGVAAEHLWLPHTVRYILPYEVEPSAFTLIRPPFRCLRKEIVTASTS